MIKYLRETGMKNLDQNNTEIITKITFSGFDKLLLTKDFKKFKVLDTAKIRTVS